MEHIVTDTTEERRKLKELMENCPKARRAVKRFDKKFESRRKKRLAREARIARVAGKNRVRYGGAVEKV